MKERPEHSTVRPHTPRTGILHWIKFALSRAYRCECEIEELLSKFVITSAPFTRPIFYRHAQLSTPENVLFEVSTEGSLRISPIDIDRKGGEPITLHIDAGRHVISISLVSEYLPDNRLSVSPSVSESRYICYIFFFNEMQVKRERLIWQITRGRRPTDELIAGGVIEGADMNYFRETVLLWERLKGGATLMIDPLPRKRSELP